MPKIKTLPHWSVVHTIVFDFDGVFTDNKVWIDQDGKESVRCDRGDGLALDFLRAFSAAKLWKVDCFILSKETNPVVGARARKLGLKCEQAIIDKRSFIQEYLANRFPSEGNFWTGLIYLGNDLNDLAMALSECFFVAPIDAHPLILKNADLVVSKKGGEGFVRHFVENLIKLSDVSADEVRVLLSKNGRKQN